MPVINLSLAGISQSVVRPMVYAIIGQVQELVKINKDTRIFYPGPLEVNQTPNANIDSENDKRAIYGTDRYLYIDVEETYDEGELSSTAINQKENIPIFYDKEIDFAVWPIYSKTDFLVSFKYHTVSKTEADRWTSDIRMRITQMRDTPLHFIDYHYGLPKPIWELIEAIYTHKARLMNPVPTIEEYVRFFATSRLSLASDQSNKTYDFVISERQSRIIGQFDFSPLPEKVERQGDSGGWLCSFNYKFSIMKPDGIGARYPISVYNRLLDDRYIAFRDQKEDPLKRIYTQTQSMTAMSMFESDRMLLDHVNIYIPFQIPTYDEFITKKGPAGYGSVLSVLLELDELDTQDILNINDLDPYVFDEDILEFMRESEYPFMHHAYRSVFYTGLYQDYQYYSDRVLNIDSALNIRSDISLNPKRLYHLLFSLIIDVDYLHPDAWARLRRYPKAFVKIVQAVNEGLRDHHDLRILARNKIVSAKDFKDFYHWRGNDATRRNFIGFKTVQLTHVITHKSTYVE